MTKLFPWIAASLAVMMLWEKGKFDLDDPLSKLLPEFAFPHLVAEFNPAASSNTPMPADREPTIRQLLTHTVGYPYPNNPDEAISTLDAKKRNLRRHPRWKHLPEGGNAEDCRHAKQGESIEIIHDNILRQIKI